ncbi:MAG TPA: hypothetical protein VGM90_19360 [Kofleriaceae bacterium]
MRALAPVLVVLGACGGSSLGDTCTTVDDCSDGLICGSVTVMDGAMCLEVTRVCTRACTSDPECTALDSEWACRPGCLGDVCFGPE